MHTRRAPPNTAQQCTPTQVRALLQEWPILLGGRVHQHVLHNRDCVVALHPRLHVCTQGRGRLWVVGAAAAGGSARRRQAAAAGAQRWPEWDAARGGAELACGQHEGAGAVLLNQDHLLVRAHAVPAARGRGAMPRHHRLRCRGAGAALQPQQASSTEGQWRGITSCDPAGFVQVPAAAHTASHTQHCGAHMPPLPASLEGVQLPEHGGAGDEQVGARGHAPLVGRLGIRQDPAPTPPSKWNILSSVQAEQAGTCTHTPRRVAASAARSSTGRPLTIRTR